MPIIKYNKNQMTINNLDDQIDTTKSIKWKIKVSYAIQMILLYIGLMIFAIIIVCAAAVAGLYIYLGIFA